MTKTFLFLIYVAITILFMEFILYHISKKFLLFEVIQNSIDKLDVERRKRASFISYVATGLVFLFIASNQLSILGEGLIFGTLFSIRDVYFKETYLEKKK